MELFPLRVYGRIGQARNADDDCDLPPFKLCECMLGYCIWEAGGGMLAFFVDVLQLPLFFAAPPRNGIYAADAPSNDLCDLTEQSVACLVAESIIHF